MKTRSGGGKLLLRRKTPLTRCSVAYFHSGAHNTEGLLEIISSSFSLS